MNLSVPLPYRFSTSSVPVPSLVRARHFKALQGTARQGTSRQARALHIHRLIFVHNSPTVTREVVG